LRHLNNHIHVIGSVFTSGDFLNIHDYSCFIVEFCPLSTAIVNTRQGLSKNNQESKKSA